MLDQLYMQDLADAMKIPAEPLPTGKVTVSGPQVEAEPKQPEMGTITGIPQTAFEKALETSGVKLSELGDMIDQSAPGTLNTLLGREVPIIGNLKLRDFLPFVGSKDEGKLTGTPAALIAAGTGQPLRGQPVVGSAIGPDGQRYYGTSGSPAMLSEDVGTAVMDVATLGLGKPLAAGAKKAVKATKNLPVGMSTKAVGQGVDELGFYSAAKQAVDAIQQPKGTGEQFLKQIEKTPGVKPEEVKWTGLDDFLKSKKSVTKAEVQDYLNSNRVEVKEVTLGENKGFDVAKELNSKLADKGYTVTYNPQSDTYIYLSPEGNRTSYVQLPSEIRNIVNDVDFRAEKENSTKFSKYTLPGGENYREILLTLPTKMVSEDEARVILNAKPDAKLSAADISFASRKKADEFKSQHFDQPNILAHLRVNDRVDADGKKVLFVEEVQSDWHQAGRKQGYNTPEKRAADQKKLDALDAEREQLRVEQARLEELAKPFTDEGKDAPADILDKWNMVSNRLNNLQREYAPIANLMKTGSGVPDAPFKTTWSDLSMKRVIQMASEGGYDRIAFTTGKTQAERFDLSKQINRVAYDDNFSGGVGRADLKGEPTAGMLVAYDKEGKKVISQRVKPDELENYIGKDVAKKLLEASPNNVTTSGIGARRKELSGVDLQVGGEGMKGFYDDILPKFLNKYAKKWDAKAGMTSINTGEKGGDAFEVVLPNGKVVSSYASKKQAESSAKSFEGAKVRAIDTGEPVHYIDITPKMRESVVTKGQPLFAVGAGGAGAAATQEENK